MLALVAAAVVGGPLTAALFWHEGVLTAVMAAPVGGSLCAAAAAAYLGLRSGAAAGRRRAARAVSARFGSEWHATAH